MLEATRWCCDARKRARLVGHGASRDRRSRRGCARRPPSAGPGRTGPRAPARPACRGCTARTTRPTGSADTPRATAAKSVVSSKTMKPAVPRPLPIASSASYVRGVSSCDAGTSALETPVITATTSRPRTAPRPTMSMTSRSGVPIATSATPWRRVRPDTVQTIVPGDSAVPAARNQSAPSASTRATFAIVSTLFTSVGGAASAASGAAIVNCEAEASSGPTSSTPWR